MSPFRVALAQINTTVGNFEENTSKIISFCKKAKSREADIVCFPELSVCGYPPLDLLERESFIEGNMDAVERIADAIDGIDVIVGYASSNEKPNQKPVQNTSCVIRNGEILQEHHKILLPTSHGFVESRYFTAGDDVSTFSNGPYVIGQAIGESSWKSNEISDVFDHPVSDRNPLSELDSMGVDCVFNPSASSYIAGKEQLRISEIQRLAMEYNIYIGNCNLVGATDYQVFDGTSVIVDSNGEVIARAKSFEEDIIVSDLNDQEPVTREFIHESAGVYKGIMTGLTDYMSKTGYSQVLLGLSGGIDSSLTATLAVDALGADNVLGLLLPSVHSSDESITDALALADNLGIRTITVPIGELYGEFEGTMNEVFGDVEWDFAMYKNQHRLRNDILMTLCSRYGYLLLATGNKSELAVGYCTIYGDLGGVLAPISDVPKTMVYELVEERNKQSSVIPQSVIDKDPSAELAPGQKDQDQLPPYETLDGIIHGYFEERKSPEELVSDGYEREVVERMIKLIDFSEFMRQQAPLGIQVTSKRPFSARFVPDAQNFL